MKNDKNEYRKANYECLSCSQFHETDIPDDEDEVWEERATYKCCRDFYRTYLIKTKYGVTFTAPYYWPSYDKKLFHMPNARNYEEYSDIGNYDECYVNHLKTILKDKNKTISKMVEKFNIKPEDIE